MSNKRRLWSILGAAPLFALLGGCGSDADAQKSVRAPSVPVTVASVTRRMVPLTIRAAGSVEAAASVVVVSRVDGPIVSVLVKDGQDVKADQALVQIDPQPLRIQVRTAEANLARDSAQLDDAHAKEARGRALLAQHYISNEEYLQLKANLDSAAATVRADRAALDQAKLQLGYSTVRAPVSGRIGHLALQVGNMVHAAAAEPLTTLNVLDTVDVSFAVPEQNLAAIQQALAANSAKVIVLPPAGSSSRALTGELSFIDNAIDRTSGTIRLRARFSNGEHVLWPGQFVAVDLALASEEAAIVVPAVAIAEGPEGSYVFVVKNDLAVEQRAVKVARLAGEDALVSGVQPGERVVVDGQSRLTPGARVSIRSKPAAA